MASADFVLKVKADISDFEIAYFRTRLEVAKIESEFWERKLADAITKRDLG